MSLLIFYLFLAIGVSFLCSLCEAALLSVPDSHGAVLTKQGNPVGPKLEAMKRSIDRPLGAILTLNTVAHTIGAAGVGAQSAVVFGDAWVAATSVVLTLAILILSEIIPKTVGAVHAVRLTGFTVLTVRLMILGTAPLLWVLDFIGALLRGKGETRVWSRESLAVSSELAEAEGSLHGREGELVRNVLSLSTQRVSEIMTPRTVVHMEQCDHTVLQASVDEQFKRFSRIPIYGENSDDVLGMVTRYDIYEALRAGNEETKLSDLARPLHAVPESAHLISVLEQFASRGDHLFLVVDEYGGTAGIITLEDVVESALGHELVDETDAVADMRTLVRSEVSENEEGERPSGEVGKNDQGEHEKE